MNISSPVSVQATEAKAVSNSTEADEQAPPSSLHPTMRLMKLSIFDRDREKQRMSILDTRLDKLSVQ